MSAKDFKGIFAALTTPFVDGEISASYFKENIKKYNSTDLAGYVILGSTGEAVHLTDEESFMLVKIAKETSSSGKKIIAGTARESTRHTIEFTNRLASLGIDAVLIRTPGYFKSQLTSEALKNHYFTIADNVKIPILVYNIPQNTGVSIDASLVCELARHPNIVGIKDSSGNLAFLSEVIPNLPPGFSFLLGAGSLIFPGLYLGASGAILAMADAVPDQCTNIYSLFCQNKMEEAKKLQMDLVPLNKLLTQIYGVPAVKYAMDCLGFYGGEPRSPLLPLNDKGREKVRIILEKLSHFVKTRKNI